LAELSAQNISVKMQISGYFQSELDRKKVLESLGSAKYSLVLVGLGAGPQEEFCLEAINSYSSKHLFLTVGGLFDHIAGATARAPKVIQNIGLEWLWRSIQEPKRLLWRYLSGNAFFIFKSTILSFKKNVQLD
jgi:N-acetylglucosaminyldiphosphoundecaprenol N-acetyl-beta-D-mannosaminyltransferase